MEDYKYSIFEDENNGQKLLVMPILNIEYQKKILAEISFQLRISSLDEETNFYELLKIRLGFKVKIDNIEAGAVFKTTLERFGAIKNNFDNSSAYLLWGIDSMDITSLEVLVKDWEYIWYPPSDHSLVIYLREEKKIFLVTHYEMVYHN